MTQTQTQVKPKALPLPSFYDPKKIVDGQPGLWMVEYEKRAADAYAWKTAHNITPACLDANPICVVPIDVQNTFINKDGGLPVPGAFEASRRAIEWGYKWMPYISMWAPTMDTHTVHQIFHAAFLVDENGNHPGPFTQVKNEDIGTKWRINSAIVQAVFPDLASDKRSEGDTYLRQYLRHYTGELKKNGQFDLTTWPYHAMLGGLEHALLPSLHELIFFSEIARDYDRFTSVKGGSNLTENYAPQEPEVTKDHIGRAVGQKNTNFLKLLLRHKYIVAWGFASSHCFKWFGEKLVRDIKAHDPSLLKKIYFLKNCTAPVPAIRDGKGTILVDFPKIAEDAFTSFAAEGINVIEDETIPLDEWPNMDLSV